MIDFNIPLQQFIQTHIDDDTSALLLAAHRYPNIDMTFVAEQIEARKRMKTKLPEWYANPKLIMSGRIPAEQCSSEQTAKYKQTIIEGAESICDMTGGMGVDLYYMSAGMKRIVYTERNTSLCEATKHNFTQLGRTIEVRNGDGQQMPIPDVDVIYIDPARRAADGSRVYAIEDCEPNVLEWQDNLLNHCNTLLIKLSPMIDITEAIRKLHSITDIHIVAVKNECKEVLVKCTPNSTTDSVTIHCIDYLSSHTMHYTYSTSEQSNIQVINNDYTLLYIYEPDVTLMKCQAFASLCTRYQVKQLDKDTHLMTSQTPIHNFPGRSFTVQQIIPFSSKTIKQLKKQIPQANISTRNFPLTADQLRTRTAIKDGGDIYLFATTIRSEKMIIIAKTL